MELLCGVKMVFRSLVLQLELVLLCSLVDATPLPNARTPFHPLGGFANQ